jgi:glucokinase
MTTLPTRPHTASQEVFHAAHASPRVRHLHCVSRHSPLPLGAIAVHVSGGVQRCEMITAAHRAMVTHAITFEHVSYERLVSGPGLYHIYRFLRDTGRGEEPLWLGEEMRAGDPAAAITRAALTGTCPLCVHALDLFVSIYGAEAGNLALKVMATGGVFVGGGIAPKIIAKLREPLFIKAFTAKGRLRPLLEAIPVRVILNDKTALLGAARYATCAGGLRRPMHAFVKEAWR